MVSQIAKWTQRNAKTIKRIISWATLVFSVVGWPLSIFTFAKGEPQTVLHLSWGAIFLGALDAVFIVEKD